MHIYIGRIFSLHAFCHDAFWQRIRQAKMLLRGRPFRCRGLYLYATMAQRSVCSGRSCSTRAWSASSKHLCEICVIFYSSLKFDDLNFRFFLFFQFPDRHRKPDRQARTVMRHIIGWSHNDDELINLIPRLHDRANIEQIWSIEQTTSWLVQLNI